MLAELCRDVAFEAARRSTRINPHELWAVLEDVNALAPRLIVDLWSDPAMRWAWWSLGARVVAVTPVAWYGEGFDRPQVPEGVVDIEGDPKDASVRQRVADQCTGCAVDVVAFGGPNSEDGMRWEWTSYSPMARPGGALVVQGIANDRFPGIGRFWSALDPCGSKEYVGGFSPDGYGLVQVHGRDRLSHG